MAVLYIDNFRGFNNAFLPLNDINFFVGENSTGKTSILKLIKIISSDTFWFDLELNSTPTELGYYSEIANQNSEKKYFEIGLVSSFKKDEDATNINAVKIRYTNENGQPTASELSFIEGGLNIQATFRGSDIKYKYSNIDSKKIENISDLEFLKDWVKDNGLKRLRYKKMEKIKGNMFSKVPFFQLQNVIINELKKEKDNDNSYRITIPRFLNEIIWLAPIRTEPRRTYDSYKTTFNPTGLHTPYLLKSMLSIDSAKKNKAIANDIQILNKFGRDSGLFDSVQINMLGNKEDSPFEIHILLNGRPLKITNVGYGVSQILPVVIEVIMSNKNSWFSIQQPEIHLHPRGQAAFGDFIFDIQDKENKKFIIETHSDYIIDRFRIRINRKKGDFDKSCQIVFFRRDDTGNSFFCIPINKDGSLPDDQPSDFRDFFIREGLELLQI
ncbi:AAA family ATPase [Spirosoma flavum]|uniref:AAA family ATPase n=1 Tax=Spirosoma flavum TaxID=2048557 RepID=A0ABW6ASD2_9BACT